MFTVHYDNGRKPIFEKFDEREDADRRVLELVYEYGYIAIILEDYDE